MFQNVFFFLKPKDEISYLYSNMSLLDGLQHMKSTGFSAMPVIDNEGHYMGSISEGDFLWYLNDHPMVNKEEVMLEEIIRNDFMPAQHIMTSSEDLFNQSLNQNFVPIVDDRNIFIGIVTRRNILSYLMKQTQSVDITYRDRTYDTV